MTARKIMLLGEIGVGKSSLVRRLMFDRFETDYKPTIGVDVYSYTMHATPQRPALTLIIWDTDGNFGDAIFKHIYMKEASGALIVSDLSRPNTLATMQSLGEGFQSMFPGRHVGYVLNKVDLISDLEKMPLPKFLKRPGVSCTQTSARTGDHVGAAFEDAADCISRRTS